MTTPPTPKPTREQIDAYLVACLLAWLDEQAARLTADEPIGVAA